MYIRKINLFGRNSMTTLSKSFSLCKRSGTVTANGFAVLSPSKRKFTNAILIFFHWFRSQRKYLHRYSYKNRRPFKRDDLSFWKRKRDVFIIHIFCHFELYSVLCSPSCCLLWLILCDRASHLLAISICPNRWLTKSKDAQVRHDKEKLW